MGTLNNPKIEIPIRDICDYKNIKRPYLTYGLIITLIITFCIQILYLKDGYWDYTLNWNSILQGQYWRLITHIFLHANWWYWIIPIHLASNLYYIWLFSDNTEDWFAKNNYLRLLFIPFFLVCGLIAGIVFGISQPDTYALGASGAISGIMGFYFIMYPYAQIDVLSLKVVPIQKWDDLEEIWKSKVIYTVSAYYYLFAWFGVQFIAWWYLSGETIAYLAHIAGFISGAVIALVGKLVAKEEISSEFISKLITSIRELLNKITGRGGQVVPC